MSRVREFPCLALRKRVWRAVQAAAAAAASLAAVTAVSGVAGAVAYPTRAINLVVPYSSGGGVELTARAMAAVAQKHLGQPLVVLLKPGGGTVLGLTEVARSRPDGYTLALAGPHALVASHFQSVPLNMLEDLIPVARVVDWQWTLLVRADSPFTSLASMLQYARENPGKLVMANSGNLQIGHLPALQLEMMAGVKFNHLPFNGGGPANMSVLTGTAHAVHAADSTAVPLVRSGQARALAVTGPKRLPDLPDVPTYRELGYNIQTTAEIGLFAPKGTPQEIVQFLEEAVRRMSEDPEFVQLIQRMGDRVAYMNSAEFRQKLELTNSQAAEVARVLRASGVLR